MDKLETFESIESIAIIGIAGRFPGAKNVEEFWHNLCNGVESISFFSEEELAAAGVDRALLNNPNYVKANAVLEDIEMFDAAFFGFTPREAQAMDPQQRLLLECAWNALENAGYDSQTYPGRIGIYAGSSMSSYLYRNLSSNPDLLKLVDFDWLQQQDPISLGNDRDYLTTRISYKLGLTGPSMSINTACSTSLVAVHTACQSLLNYQCEMALAGGVSIQVPQISGYLYREGGIASPDGHCRTFDAKAQGTLFCSGLGLVLLKRLEDALADGDYIYAVIKGSAINNDGTQKVSYTAPSVEGQVGVITEALAVAGISPETISYIEAHGTGTALGDPIEVAAMTQAFRASTDKKGFCAIGSVKPNVGHLNRAAGIASLIKTLMALKHQLIPLSLNYEQPNPNLDFGNSPFFVNTTLREWKTNGTPRRAGVTSLGFGGTNAHAVLEEAPLTEPSDASRTCQLLLLSAKSDSALETATKNLASHLKQHPELNLADVAYTLQIGRRGFNHRRMLVCRDLADAVTALETLEPKRIVTQFQEPKERSVVFMFSGQGSQYVNMALELYQSEPTFREEIDLCAEILQPHLGLDLRDLLYPDQDQAEEATELLKQTSMTQPALFVIEYALAQLWMSWGIHPAATIGHSIGEYVAACIAGVFSLEDALSLVAARGKMMQQMPPGSMLAVPLSERELQPYLGNGLSLALINGPSRCVVSGTGEAIDGLEKQLAAQGVEGRRLHTSHAFHSEMMEPVLDAFAALVKKVTLNPPEIPYVSNVTGTWITAEQATDPNYWAKHLRQTVRFAEGLQKLFQDGEQILLEVGPGRTLSTLALQHPEKSSEQVVLTSVRHPQDSQSDLAFLLNTLGKLWLAGVQVDWSGFYEGERRYRLPLPTYAFDLKRHWIELEQQVESVDANKSKGKKQDIADWFYLPSWKRLLAHAQTDRMSLGSTLVFMDECGLAVQLVQKLAGEGINAIAVKIGSDFNQISDRAYTLNPQQPSHYDTLLEQLRKLNQLPKTIVHLWSVTPNDSQGAELESVKKAQDLGFYSLLFLAQAIGKQNLNDELQIAVVSNNMQAVTSQELLSPEKATVLAPCKVIPQEYPNIKCRSIDVVIPQAGSWQADKLIDRLLDEIQAKSSDIIVAYRGNYRWVQTFEAIRLEQSNPRLKPGGAYLITGGLGSIGFVLAEHLAKTIGAKLILTGRSAPPARQNWEQWLANHDEQDSISRKIRKVEQLEALGAEVLVVKADVADGQQMQDAIALAEAQFGHLNGVIHAAGILDEKSLYPIAETGYTECQQQFQPKVYGLLTLEKVLQDKKLDFCLLMSSISTVLGGLKLVAYSAVNLFMDAFVERHNQTNSVPWISVNWDAWQGELHRGNSLAQLAIAPTEGVSALERILSSDEFDRVVVSTADLQGRIDKWIKFESLRDGENNHPENSSSLSMSANNQAKNKNEVEDTLANIWTKVLGIEQIGSDDNFFDLGGDSLTSIKVISMLRETFQVSLPPTTLFDKPTVASLSELVETIRWVAPESVSTPDENFEEGEI